ncbi:hypothetical protein H5410_010368 [Solanum commersonii]|uniref:Uncharacterized protein n=1 Tax=Solanum commersonii TaxID=4109 RepID=A0A9J6AKI8_SOLCO|nr:hypothetical protein H5410_010368 [Solanum commersonii]
MLRACEEQMYKCPSKKLWKVGHGGSEEKLDRQKKYVRKEIRQNMIYLKLNEDMHLDRRIWKMISQSLTGHGVEENGKILQCSTTTLE